MIWDALAERGISPEDRATWAPPLVRVNCPEGEPFAAAGTSPLLHAAYDEAQPAVAVPDGFALDGCDRSPVVRAIDAGLALARAY